MSCVLDDGLGNILSSDSKPDDFQVYASNSPSSAPTAEKVTNIDNRTHPHLCLFQNAIIAVFKRRYGNK